MSTAAGRLATLVVASFVAAALVWHYARSVDRADLVAFYCGSRVAVTGHDPYLLQPLASCEHALAGSGGDVIRPAPAPGYFLAILGVVALLPFRAFAAIYFTLTLGALITCAYTLGKLFRLLPYVVLAALAPLAYVCFKYGQMLPVAAVAALCVSALLLSSRRHAAAGVAAGAAMCEPHVGLPSVLALVLFVPQARIATIATCALLGGISLATLGLAANVEYLTKELPSQARAEIVFPAQYGIPWLAHALGASDKAAVALGGVAFVVALVLVLAMSRRLAISFGRPEAFVLIPPLAALVGVFLHAWNLMAAAPACLFLADCERGSAAKRTAVVALVLFVVPWFVLATWPLSTPLLWISALLVAICAYSLDRESASPQSQALFAAATACGVVALTVLLHAAPTGTPRPSATAGEMAALTYRPPTSLASTYWGAFLRDVYPAGSESARYVAAKIPMWAGLLLALACIMASMTTRERPTVVNRSPR